MLTTRQMQQRRATLFGQHFLFVLEQVSHHVQHCLLTIASLLALLLVVEAEHNTLVGAGDAHPSLRLAPDLELLLAHQGVLDPTEPHSARVLPLGAVLNDLPEDVGFINLHVLGLVVTDCELLGAWVLENSTPLLNPFHGRCSVEHAIGLARNTASVAISLIDEPLLARGVPCLVLTHDCEWLGVLPIELNGLESKW